MAHPFVKWAGGKGQLVDRLVARMPSSYEDYFEPFVGGGAMLFALEHVNVGRRVVVNDINAALIGAYKALKDDTDSVIAGIAELDAGLAAVQEGADAYYYDCRVAFNEFLAAGTYDSVCASYLIWINKHAFNGLYRVNKKGLFNVPWNKSSLPCLDEKNLRAVSGALRNVEVRCGDFSDALLGAKPGDFVFLDSPYVPVKADSFTDYTKDGFTYDDHVRLSKTFRELAERGVYVMETNHDVDLIHELYGDWNIESTSVKRMINSDASKRTGKEVIITSYETSV